MGTLWPFLLDEVRQWPCAHGDIAAQLAAANEDHFLAKWLAERDLSPASRAVLDAARRLYREFYANITNTPWMDWKIETWDVGYYQVRNAMKGLLSLRGDSEIRSLGENSKKSPNLQDSKTPSRESNHAKTTLAAIHDALRAKLLPQIYSFGFLNPDVEYFK